MGHIHLSIIDETNMASEAVPKSNDIQGFTGKTIRDVYN
jgi:hypothetical protein